MPGMNGVELGQRLRRDYPHFPVVLASGYDDFLAPDETHGFTPLHKTYSLEALSRVLRKAIIGQR